MKYPALAAGLAALALACVQPALAQGYPSRPVTIVVPFQAGGGVDTIARLLSTHLGPQLNGQPVIVDNRPSASGNIGAAYVAHAAADGYTLLLTNNTLTINASVGFTQGFDVRKDLAPIAIAVSSPVAIGVNAGYPAKTMAELVDYVKKNPGHNNFSSCSTGSPQHFAGAAINQDAGLDMMHVPYKGCAPAISDALGNQVPILSSTVPNLAPHAKTGKLRILAVTSAKRLSFMPDIPSITETPIFKDMDITVWFGLFAPAGLPADIKARLENAMIATLKDPALKEEFHSRYYEVEAIGSAGMAAQVEKDIALYGQLAKNAHITLE